ncbi:MAG: bacteriophage abortive infection AbiH family protein [Oscillospiraceae bacterium]|nr:bacteriophage abortive infection AbiH family protein [Oscillospiraceae bacterium]
MEHQQYLAQLPNWNVVSRDSIQPKAEQVLYILGNGFDLMHRVPSSYYSFRDSLGKNNPLRLALENFWTPEDIWADFENALAKFNGDAMSDSFMVDFWLGNYEAYDEDAGLAEFYMAVEGAANPMLTVIRELPRRFRMWVESLKLGTADRPLKCLFRDGKVLCFNYTEFVEDLYGVSEENVCYIHGCRRKKKGAAKEKLVLGHMPGESYAAFDRPEKKPRWHKDPKKRGLVEAARNHVLQLIADCDEELTKYSSDIIARHRPFFDGLSGIRDIVVIGHSLSQVDREYFEAVCGGLSDRQYVRWYFGCHGLRDLQNVERLITELEIPRSAVSVFRTDDITVRPLPAPAPVPAAPKPPKSCHSASEDRKWSVRITGVSMEILDDSGDPQYEVLLPGSAGNAFFTPSGEYLFVIIRGVGSGVMLFRYTSGDWQFVDELEEIPNQGVINRRLNRVFLNGHEMTFVYNSRIRVYDLRDGRLIRNQAIRRANDRAYAGADMSACFVK